MENERKLHIWKWKQLIGLFMATQYDIMCLEEDLFTGWIGFMMSQEKGRKMVIKRSCQCHVWINRGV